MSYRRETWRDFVKRQRAEQNRRRHRRRIRRKRLKGGTDHDRARVITQEQLEHAHDSQAYGPATYGTNQNAISNPKPKPEGRPEDVDSTDDIDSADDADSTDDADSPEPKRSKPDKPASRPQPILIPPDLLDINADAIGSLEQQIAALNGGQAARNNPAPSEQAQTSAADEFGNTPLTQGQAMHIDHLLSTETDTLAREALITLKRDGLPPKSQWREFLTQYALSGWYAGSDAIAWATLAASAKSDWDERLGHADSQLADAEKQQPYIPTIGVKVSGALRVYADEAFDPSLDAPVQTFRNDYTSAPLSVLRYSKSNALRVLVEIGDAKYWIDTTDEDAKFTFVALGEYDDTSEQEAGGVVAPGTESQHYRQSIVPGEDAGTEDVEVSHRVCADRTHSKLGWLTRDYNTASNTEFDVQSPIIGPDVRVELVSRAESDPESSLGNYVVISFPASVYLSDPEIMHQLKMQNLASQRLWNRSEASHLTHAKRAQMQRMAHLTQHNAERWQEDGRIMMAYAHLSEFGPHTVPGQIIDDADKSLIGKTGNTGKDIQYHHLDLLEVYVGSSEPGSGALEKWMDWLRQKYVGEESQDVEHFFQLAIKSQLYPHGGSSLTVRIWTPQGLNPNSTL
ncbi:MAG: hypothetical protein OXG85_03200 [Chloroflexi bacterium]|nr:hypothetical protein [Chloroflexota bacterium]